MSDDGNSKPKGQRARFARLYSDGSLGVMPTGTDFVEARRALCDSHDDPDVELLEIQVSVVRTHGKPKLQLVGDVYATCPTCGEEVHAEEAQEEIERLRRELDAVQATRNTP